MPERGYSHNWRGLRPGDSIAVQAHSQFRGLLAGICKLIRDDGVNVYLYCGNKEEKKFYDGKYPKLFNEVIVAAHLYQQYSEIEAEKDLFDEARMLEAKLGTTYNELLLNDRHFGRGFSVGGYYHPRSRMSEERNYHQIVAATNTTLKFWLDEFESKRVSLCLNFGRLPNIVARSLGIPVRIPTLLRYEDRYYWAYDEQQQSPRIAEQFAVSEPDENVRFEGAYGAYKSYRAKIKGRVGAHVFVCRAALTILRYAYWKLRGYEKAKGYYLKELVSYLWRHRCATNEMMSSDLPSLEDLEGKRFIFFPLSTEPESLQTLSPEYFYQLAFITSIARDLPVGVYLVVKEHLAAVGRRPKNFYGQIMEFKNVIMANIQEDGVALMRQSEAVAIITGTSGLEAAVSGKPIITYGRQNIYNFLPHVSVIKEETELKDALHRVTSRAIDLEQARYDGEKFLKALVDISFRLKSFSPWNPDVIDEDDIGVAYDALLKSAEKES